MSALALSFNNTQFDVIDRNQQPWLRGTQIGDALGYKKAGRISIDKLYKANADEFTDSMTALVELDTNGGKQQVRIFSLRGCHLLAMFARTAVAKEFRKWVLDVLEKHTQPRYGLAELPEPPTRTAIAGCLTRGQQDVIKALVKERAEALPKEMQAGATIRCWSAIKKKFGCSYKEVPSDNFVNVISLLSRLPLEGELLAPPAPEQLLSRSEVEAMINERMKAPAIPVKLPHTGQTLGFNIEANLKLDGLIDGLERYGYRIIRIRNDAGLLS